MTRQNITAELFAENPVLTENKYAPHATATSEQHTHEWVFQVHCEAEDLVHTEDLIIYHIRWSYNGIVVIYNTTWKCNSSWSVTLQSHTSTSHLNGSVHSISYLMLTASIHSSHASATSTQCTRHNSIWYPLRQCGSSRRQFASTAGSAKEYIQLWHISVYSLLTRHCNPPRMGFRVHWDKRMISSFNFRAKLKFFAQWYTGTCKNYLFWARSFIARDPYTLTQNSDMNWNLCALQKLFRINSSNMHSCNLCDENSRLLRCWLLQSNKQSTAITHDHTRIPASNDAPLIAPEWNEVSVSVKYGDVSTRFSSPDESWMSHAELPSS